MAEGSAGWRGSDGERETDGLEGEEPRTGHARRWRWPVAARCDRAAAQLVVPLSAARQGACDGPRRLSRCLARQCSRQGRGRPQASCRRHRPDRPARSGAAGGSGRAGAGNHLRGGGAGLHRGARSRLAQRQARGTVAQHNPRWDEIDMAHAPRTSPGRAAVRMANAIFRPSV